MVPPADALSDSAVRIARNDTSTSTFCCMRVCERERQRECVCVSVCVCERERDREKVRERERVCVCVCDTLRDCAVCVARNDTSTSTF